MPQRFWVSAVLAIPVFFSAMAAEFWPAQMAEIIAAAAMSFSSVSVITNALHLRRVSL